MLGIDPGTVRVGLALSDPEQLVATPLDTLAADDDLGALAVRLAEIAAERGCETAVVGLPRALSGRDTAAAQRSRRLARALEAEGLDVHLWDERLSSAEAERALLAAGERRAVRRTARDRVAATLILQGWLDTRRRG